jgi:hypothetical protein
VDPLPRVSLYRSVNESQLSYPHRTTPRLKAGRKIVLKIYLLVVMLCVRSFPDAALNRKHPGGDNNSAECNI